MLSVPGRLDPILVDDWIAELIRRYGHGLLRFCAHVTLAPSDDPGGPTVFRGLRSHLEHEADPRRRHPSNHGPATSLNRLAIMGRGLDFDELQGALAGCVVV